MPASTTSHLDELVGQLAGDRTNTSGFLILQEGRSAFAARAAITRVAERSLDVQTYIWHEDLTGRYLAHELLQAAERGVRVRLLLDDLDARGKNDALLALDKHANIEVRLFNPFASRRGSMRMLGDFARNFQRLNRRMHIKNWIADNRVAIAGGRNVGDEYFDASDDTNFADLELLMVGEVVADGSAAFDRYWNSPQVFRAEYLDPDNAEEANLTAVRARLQTSADAAGHSAYADALRRDPLVDALLAGTLSLEWDSNAQLVADDPDKSNRAGVDASNVLALLVPRIESASREVTIASPYFVPGRSGTALLVKLAERGVAVRVLTNSLAANDVAAVHGGYSKYRKQLLRGGVMLWELKPSAGAATSSSLLGSSGASLHAKALSVDDRGLFVGSYNLDSRSTSLNSEMGVYLTSKALASEFSNAFEDGISPAHAWQVTLNGDSLVWSAGTTTYESEPDASPWQRFQAWLTKWLPVDSLL